MADGGEVLGLTADGFANEDKLELHLVKLMKDRVSEVFLLVTPVPLLTPARSAHDARPRQRGAGRA
jgi:hypothetical protein